MAGVHHGLTTHPAVRAGHDPLHLVEPAVAEQAQTDEHLVGFAALTPQVGEVMDGALLRAAERVRVDIPAARVAAVRVLIPPAVDTVLPGCPC